MSLIDRILLLTILCVSAAPGQTNTRKPHTGYLYPAGGQQGTVVIITAGGQFLNGVTEVYVSGEGVHASVIKHIQPFTNISAEQRQLLQMRLKEVEAKRLSELAGNEQTLSNSSETPIRQAPKESVRLNRTDSNQVETVRMPDHPLLYGLDNKSIKEIVHIRNILLSNRTKQQPNRQIAEMVLIEITIDQNATPGNRELRLLTPNGLTNPMVFQVGLLPEVPELEPNNKQASFNLPKEDVPDIPVVLNGQILPGDVDCFCFRAQQGQHLVVEVQARSLIPYLADAVPGWFQATLALFDANGRELAFVDDYRFNPDPVLFYQIPEEGEYMLEIRDSIYRGREDFVYRITVGEQPFITQMFPLGGRQDVKTVVSVDGWNLSEKQLSLNTQPGDKGTRQTAILQDNGISNQVLYTVDTLPECNETEPNDTIRDAQSINLPMIINGRIDRSGDIDVFRFEGRTGDKIVAEVYSRRLNSPLDSILRLTDASGKVLEWNDDYVVKDNYLYKDVSGLITHHADSYIMAELPKDGMYFIHLADSQNHGGQAYGYRLRITAPQPDFALFMIPSSLSVRPGGFTPVDIYALRQDGFTGEINVVLKDSPASFELSGARIPAGSDHVRVTLLAPLKIPDQPVAIHLEGRANITGQVVTHSAVPSEDMMQAFLYRHLVSSQELLVSVSKARFPISPVELDGNGIVRIPVGGQARVLVKTVKHPILQEIRLALDEPPEGVSLQDVTIVTEGIAFNLKADVKTVKSGFADNLIVEVFREFIPSQQEGKPAPQIQRNSIGFLPAIPIEIVAQ
jgi:hypothetical protein